MTGMGFKARKKTAHEKLIDACKDELRATQYENCYCSGQETPCTLHGRIHTLVFGYDIREDR